MPAPRSLPVEYLDVAVLAAALVLASWLALRGRSRRAIFLVTVFAVVYFGYFREGCVCAVGSLQNVTQAVLPLGAALPVVVAAFFLLPLAATLFFGRTFCASVCPLGAIQDLVVIRPAAVPRPLAVGLSWLAPAYLAVVLLFAATGAGYMICRFDPFVGFFRLTGPAGMIFTGAAFLVAGMVVARPYCRFLCPYGVLLRWMSRLSRRHLTITPDICIQCRLCEDSCPFGAIRAPSLDREPGEPPAVRRAVLLLPVLVIAGALAGMALAGPAARTHPTVVLAHEVRAAGPVPVEDESLRLQAFRQSSRTTEDLLSAAAIVQGRFRLGAPAAGILLGLLIGAELIALALPGRRTGYEPDRGECLSCGRCIRTCPVEHVRVTGSDADFEAFLNRMRRRKWGGSATDLSADGLRRLMDEQGAPGQESAGDPGEGVQ